MTDTRISHVQVSGKNKYVVDILAHGHRLTGDEPAAMGGSNAGPPPYGFLLSALGACTATTLRMYAEKKGWELGDVAVDLTLFKDDAHADRIERSVSFSAPLSPEQRTKLADICERTPVTLTIKRGAPITTKLL